MTNTGNKNDFSKGSLIRHINDLAVPLVLAQMVNVLYSVVDRIYIGFIPGYATESLTGIGVCTPLIMIVVAFANLFGMGGSPLCSIERGRGNDDEAEALMGESFTLTIICGIVLTVFFLVLRRPLLCLFGASDITYPYARDYMTIYMLGSIFVMTGLGMNSFISCQGFGKTGMMTVLLGAVCNIALDPLFIFIFGMGLKGAALATVIAQFASSAWIILFLTGKRTILKIRLSTMKLSAARVRKITAMGLSSFTATFTNSLVALVCNIMLGAYGGDLYIGVMAVLHSVREVPENIIKGFTGAAQPVIGYNYGAEKYSRVRSGIKYMSISTIIFTACIWLFISVFPEPVIRIFNRDAVLVSAAVPSMRIYFFGYVMMSLQYLGNACYVGLGKAKLAMFFSIFRKIIIVVPLTLILPHVAGFGAYGVFLAEPISNFIGGAASYSTMLLMVWRRELKKPDRA